MNIQKTILYIGALMVLLTFNACEKLSDLLKVDVTVSLPVNITIPISKAGDIIYINEWIMNIDLNDEISKVNNQLGEENIKSVNIQSAYLSIPSEYRNDDVNFVLISNPIIHFQSDAKRSWTNIASWTGVCESKFLQNLNVNTSQDWLDYFKSTNRFSLKFQCQAEQDITQEIIVKGEVRFTLKVSA